MTRWQDTRVAPEGTHHTVGGEPLYDVRFDEVLKYHAPGLAPAQLGGEAWHIDLSGRPAYGQRHRRTFGFYEGFAAAQAEDGWHHVRPDGSPLYPQRYAWCGNFQGGRCTVRESKDSYFHIDQEGNPAYEQRWRYAGDFRDGIAVVQDEAGRSTHIDSQGTLLHGRWFVDLDVFHKGFARARDESGWTHVDLRGHPTYPQRFAMIEPFYNGQARVEAFDGTRLVIAEDGRALVVLRPAGTTGAPVHRKAATHARPLLPRLRGPEELQEGWRQIGAYQVDLERPLVRSVNGAIYRAWEGAAERPVLIKTRRGSSFAKREERILRCLEGHPSVPTLHDAFTLGESRWLVLEPVPGTGLGRRSRCAPLPVPEALACIDQVLDVLEALHTHGFLHTDIHPLNVLRQASSGRSWVVDFELSVPREPSGCWEGEIYWGLWEYVPAEQIRPLGRLCAASDTFAVAALLHALVTGRPPYPVNLAAAAPGDWEAIRRDCLRLRSVAVDLGQVPDSLRPLLQRALRLDPEERFGTATELRQALAESTSGFPRGKESASWRTR